MTIHKEDAWRPKYTLTPAITRDLMEIEGSRVMIGQTRLLPAMEEDIRRRARIRSTHYSTRIEGNRLTLAETQEVIEGTLRESPGRERDVREVRNYWTAFLRMEEWAGARTPVSEDLVRKLHALVEHGLRSKPTPYRDGQNVIRDSATGMIVYMPPEARDVPKLIAGLVSWIREARELPVPLISALVHYQFVTIHPFYDGNGRTARLLATYVLHLGGYGLNGFFSLEEYHARELDEYYAALAAHPDHNYYDGRLEADLTPWLEYFSRTLARVFVAAREEVARQVVPAAREQSDLTAKLDPRQRRVIALFRDRDRINAKDVSAAFGIADRTARLLLADWSKQDWLEVADSSNRARSYQLSATYRQLIGNLSA